MGRVSWDIVHLCEHVIQLQSIKSSARIFTRLTSYELDNCNLINCTYLHTTVLLYVHTFKNDND